MMTTSFPLLFWQFLMKVLQFLLDFFLLDLDIYLLPIVLQLHLIDQLLLACKHHRLPVKVFSYTFFEGNRANFPVKVVFPEPCNPDINITVGFDSKFNPIAFEPISSVSSSFTIFIIN